MRIAILGAGPAGLYLAYLIKRRQPDADVSVFEQNAATATFGFGVVFSDKALDFLREDDPQTHVAIAPQMESWNDITLVHRGERRLRRHPRSATRPFRPSGVRLARGRWRAHAHGVPPHGTHVCDQALAVEADAVVVVLEVGRAVAVEDVLRRVRAERHLLRIALQVVEQVAAWDREL